VGSSHGVFQLCSLSVFFRSTGHLSLASGCSNSIQNFAFKRGGFGTLSASLSIALYGVLTVLGLSHVVVQEHGQQMEVWEMEDY
jgi:hypothetical protein